MLRVDAPPAAGGARKATADVAWDFAPAAAGQDAPLLRRGVSELVLLGGDSAHAKTYRVVVPEGVPGFVVEQHNDTRSDVDLYVRRDLPPDVPERDADWLGITTGPEERLVVGGVRPLVAGIYYLQVGIYAEGPVLAGVTLR